jgi:hypothetical protein
MMPFTQSGGCQCGAIRYEITAPPITIYTCHCTDCQRQSGSAHGMAAVIAGAHFHIRTGTPKRFVRKTGPAKTMDCWFCGNCGTRLYHVPGGASYPNRNIKPGTLDDTSWLTPETHFWTRSAQRWVVIPAGAVCHETQPEALAWVPDKIEPA